MRFLLLLVTYILHRRFNLGVGRQLDRTALTAQTRLFTAMPALAYSGWGALLLALVLPTLMLGGLLWLVHDWMFGVLTVFIELLVLFAVLGCPRLKQQFALYLESWRDEQYQSAYHQAQIIGFRLNVGLERPQQLHRAVWRGYLMHTFSRYFSVIFWFMATGATGALFVRLVNLTAEEGQSDELRRVAGRLDQILQWVPARLLAVTFALAGNFIGCMRACMSELIDPAATATTTLSKAAKGALSGERVDVQAPATQAARDVQEMMALRDLLNRSVLVWFAALAALVLIGYF